MSKILVTGGSGFIGTNLVDSLCSKNHEVLNFDIKEPKNKAYLKKDFTTTQFKEKRVKNSFGDKEYRYFIIMKVIIM